MRLRDTVISGSIPKGPCTRRVYTALTRLYRNPFKAQVYTIWAQGPYVGTRTFGYAAGPSKLTVGQALQGSSGPSRRSQESRSEKDG